MTGRQWTVSRENATSPSIACRLRFITPNCARSARSWRPMHRREFVCEGYRFAPETGTLSLNYAFEGGPRFEERIQFPPASRSLSAPQRAALERVFRMLLLACGVSYYKAFAPERVRCTAFAVDPATAAFFTDFY